MYELDDYDIRSNGGKARYRAILCNRVLYTGTYLIVFPVEQCSLLNHIDVNLVMFGLNPCLPVTLHRVIVL